MKARKARSKAVTNYWLDWYVNAATGLCELCANSGIIKLRDRRSAAGTVHVANNVICFCPNGQELRKAGISV